MAQSLSRILIHTIFSTKNRMPFLRNQEIRARMHAYLGGVTKEFGCHSICIGGVADHVHLLTTLSRVMTVSSFVKETKRASTAWIRERRGVFSKFRWQAGYGAFSVSQSHLPSVIRYIEDQERHHRKISFQEEFRSFLSRHGVKYDERYIWD